MVQRKPAWAGGLCVLHRVGIEFEFARRRSRLPGRTISLSCTSGLSSTALAISVPKLPVPPTKMERAPRSLDLTWFSCSDAALRNIGGVHHNHSLQKFSTASGEMNGFVPPNSRGGWRRNTTFLLSRSNKLRNGIPRLNRFWLTLAAIHFGLIEGTDPFPGVRQKLSPLSSGTHGAKDPAVTRPAGTGREI